MTDLASESFIAYLIAQRGLPSIIWNDNGTNFTGELKDLYQFLEQASTQGVITHYLGDKGISWKFIPQHAPHFGGIWEAAVKSVKTHLRQVLSDVKLTYEEFSTLLYHACLNSRPLVPQPNDDDGIKALTPGHFLVGKPLTALQEATRTDSSPPKSQLKRWQLCKSLLQHFWKHWSSE